MTSEIVFTVDNGEELGGRCWLKTKELKKLIFGFGCKLIQNHKGHPEENAHLERSHCTDDDEFYIPRVLKIKSEDDLLSEALHYFYYYDCVREHSSLENQTPFGYLKKHLPEIDDAIRFATPFILDDVSVKLGPWSGYHLLAQNRKYLLLPPIHPHYQSLLDISTSNFSNSSGIFPVSIHQRISSL